MKNVLLVGLGLALVALSFLTYSYRQEAASQRPAADLRKIVQHPDMPETPSRAIVTNRSRMSNAEYYRGGQNDDRW